jgi:hypothetical protein
MEPLERDQVAERLRGVARIGIKIGHSREHAGPSRVEAGVHYSRVCRHKVNQRGDIGQGYGGRHTQQWDKMLAERGQ